MLLINCFRDIVCVCKFASSICICYFVYCLLLFEIAHMQIHFLLILNSLKCQTMLMDVSVLDHVGISPFKMDV